MERLAKGEFFGDTNRTLQLDGLTLTDTIYTHDKVGWHYHEQAYFTFIMEGAVIEGNRKEKYECPAGSLLFHHWEEPHYNIKPPGFTRGFHVEIEKEWLDSIGPDVAVQGSLRLNDPSLRMLMYKVVAETKAMSEGSSMIIQSLLVELFGGMQDRIPGISASRPPWVQIVKDILHDQQGEDLSLTQLASLAGIHPVHLSRGFSKYFNCSLGAYIRKLKVSRAMVLLASRELSLAAITYTCGFADQSHFIRCFREVNGMPPLAYRKMMFG